MGKSDIFLIIGRALITIYLIIVFVMVLSETVERSNVDKTEPDNYQETLQVMDYVSQNFYATPIANFQVFDPEALQNTTATNPSTLYEWSIDEDWCSCINSEKNVYDTFPHLGTCTQEELSSNTETCSTSSSTSVDIQVWRGSYIEITSSSGASYPLNSDNSCGSIYEVYDSSAGMCRKTTETLITAIKVVNETNITSSEGWTFAGSFASWGNSTPPNTTNITEDTEGMDLYYSTTQTGSPYINIKVSLNGIPCLNPYKTPSPINQSLVYPLGNNDTSGCGYWNTSGDLYETLDFNNEWDFFLDYDLANNVSFFRSLYGYEYATINDYAYLYAERKLIVQATDFCYSFVTNPDVETNIADIPNLSNIRTALCTLGFVLTIFAFVVFVIYMIVTRVSKKVSKESVGIYVFWLFHGLGMLYAIIAIIIGDLTNDLISTIENDNSYLTNVASAACITNVQSINEVYSYLSENINELYSYIDSYNSSGIVIAIIFLVLEFILLLWWLIGFSCQENLEEDDDRERFQKGPRN